MQGVYGHGETPAPKATQADVNPLEGHPRYAYIRPLNSGASGFVQLALDTRTNEQIAIKFIERGKRTCHRIIARELLNHRECAMHPHIVQLKAVFMTPRHLAVAMEYAPGGDLSEYVDACKRAGLGGTPETDARWFFQQFIIAVDYCHRLGIANRDIKLDNVLLDGSLPLPIIKMCDFGYSKDEVAGSLCKTACGTPEYMAPEVLTTEVYDGKGADIWSCGVMLYVMLMGAFPFRRPDDDKFKGVRRMQLMFGRIISADYIPPPRASVACRDLLQQLLCADPGKRISLHGIMNHPWFLKDLPEGTHEMNERLILSDTLSGGFCEQSAQDILDTVALCNSEMDSMEPQK